jgi:acetylornithine deacetylase
MTSLPIVTGLLEKLIRFDTVSRQSNLDLIGWIESHLSGLGAKCTRIPNAQGDKANLWVRFGPDRQGGLVLSGHTDVVPVDGQDWQTDPFVLTLREGRFYGRGTSDMKAFIALCLAFAPSLARMDLDRPVHFAFSYDEEVGCQGAPAMIDQIVAAGARPDAVWVGEPTLWKVVSAHKGLRLTEVVVTGQEAHSSLSHLGVSAIGEAIELLALLRDIQKALPETRYLDADMNPPYPTLSIGTLQGGTAVNILARECRFQFDLRCPDGVDPDRILAPFLQAASALDARLKGQFPGCGVAVHCVTDVPALSVVPGNPAEALVRALTGDNARRAVPYTTEAGQFQNAGMPAIICGPGSIDQAHMPNEYLDQGQLSQGVDIFTKLLAHLASSA